MVRKVKCPTCSKLVEYSTDNPWRPFCSERCKQIDLGAWADEKFAIPGEPLETDDLSGDSGGKLHPPPGSRLN